MLKTLKKGEETLHLEIDTRMWSYKTEYLDHFKIILLFQQETEDRIHRGGGK